MKKSYTGKLILRVRLSSARFMIKNLERAIRFCLSHHYNNMANRLLNRLDIAFLTFEQLYKQKVK